MGMIDILRVNPLFQDLEDAELEKVLEVMQEKKYDARSEIFDENLPGRELYIILSGKVRIVKITREGERQTLSVLKPGSFFGELSLLDGRKHSASAEAVENSTLLVLSQQSLASIEQNHPQVALKVIKNMALKISSILRDMNEKFMGMVNYMW
jgi:CRP-like cAMP-binding protein